MRFTFEFFRIRDGDGAHAMLDRLSEDAPDLEAAKDRAKALFKTLDMPQTPDGVRILDGGGAEVFAWKPEDLWSPEPDGEKRSADVSGHAIRVVRIATGEEVEDVEAPPEKDEAAAALGRKGGEEALSPPHPNRDSTHAPSN